MKPVISMSSVVALLFLGLLALATINICLCNGSTHVGCIESERRALLRLKKDLKDPSNRLASWNGDGGDCCNWAGVVCHNFTSHVLGLHLGNPHLIRYSTSSGLYPSPLKRSKLVGKLNPSLLDFKQLMQRKSEALEKRSEEK
ncbi:hypothetical protein Ddye_027426 [Dipteronia dyeriana]|uniref:Leucine-rich repeat-containing N-terminal plant-type domain-containing protein n=1 Tax=Dipteronia dyeriana TaxID=168575 RepID=A0AAD9WQH2_9ROSI|nr:hypothetical protein Ddye_027426 [Dipteronia dyeriana]